jgi:hypothetical protein
MAEHWMNVHSQKTPLPLPPDLAVSSGDHSVPVMVVPAHKEAFLVLTQNRHLTPSTRQAEKAGFTREEITRRASKCFLKINKR